MKAAILSLKTRLVAKYCGVAGNAQGVASDSPPVFRSAYLFQQVSTLRDGRFAFAGFKIFGGV
jgi:hypothetical protein